MRWVYLILIAIFGVLQSQPRTVTGIGEASLEELTQREAVTKALFRARRDAIEKACGAHLVSSTVVSNFTTMADVIENMTRATVQVLDSAITFRQENIPGYAQPVLIVRATIQAQVQCGMVRLSNFELTGGLTKTTLMHGDTLHLWIKASKPVYLNIFDVSEDGEVAVLYPSPFLKQTQLVANQKWVFPYPLRAECPPDKRHSGEWLYIIATETPINMAPANIRYKRVETSEGGLIWKSTTTFLQDIVETLLRIPPESRQELRLFFEVRR